MEDFPVRFRSVETASYPKASQEE